jgi:putative heme iron utilization protein
MDALPKEKPDGMTSEQAEGYEKAMAAVVRILVQRSIVV